MCPGAARPRRRCHLCDRAGGWADCVRLKRQEPQQDLFQPLLQRWKWMHPPPICRASSTLVLVGVARREGRLWAAVTATLRRTRQTRQHMPSIQGSREASSTPRAAPLRVNRAQSTPALGASPRHPDAGIRLADTRRLWCTAPRVQGFRMRAQLRHLVGVEI